VIARQANDRYGAPYLAIEGEERRILALLSVAYWRTARPAVIVQLRRASLALARGNRPLAAILVAHSGLSRLEEDERIGFRLFASEKLLDAGVTPRDLLKGLGLDLRPLDALAKDYDPDEPRVPAGQPGGGQWTSESGSANLGDGAEDEHIEIRDQPTVPQTDPGPQRSGSRVSANDPAKWAECFEECHLILDRPKPYRSSDVNQFDFYNCMNECLERPA